MTTYSYVQEEEVKRAPARILGFSEEGERTKTCFGKEKGN